MVVFVRINIESRLDRESIYFDYLLSFKLQRFLREIFWRELNHAGHSGVYIQLLRNTIYFCEFIMDL